MRLSRWGRSSYETDEALAQEAAALRPFVDVLPMHQDAEVITVNSGTRVTADWLQQVPSARLILTTTSGFDHLDVAAILARGIEVARCPLARRDAVAESTIGLMLDGLRAHAVLRTAGQRGEWVRAQLPTFRMRQLRDCRVGVVGLGVIGQQVARLLQNFGAEVWGTDPRGIPSNIQPASLPQLLAECDVVTLHCRLGRGSRQLIDREQLSNARADLVLINTARGDILDVHAAMDALSEKRLAYLGIDVFPREPWPDMARSAYLPASLLPHAAGYHDGLMAHLAQELAETVAQWCAGRGPVHPVTRADID